MANSTSHTDQRFVSRLTKDTLALILAGGQGSRLFELTQWRAKPSLYFGGKLRIIDFPLSNCVNSDIRRIGVLTQYKAHSLIRHIVRGWSTAQSDYNEFVEILPASQRIGGEWYRGTADAIYQNLDIIRTYNPELVLILAGDHVYKMDYGPLLAFHSEKQADMTVCCIEVPVEEAAGALGVMTVDEDGRILAFDEKPAEPTPIPGQTELCLASMGNYVFNRGFLFEQVIKDADMPGSQHDFGRNIIPSIVDHNRVYAYPFRDPATGRQAYWRDVGTLDSYWLANMELIDVLPPLDLYDQNWPVMTRPIQSPPAKFVFDDPDRKGTAVNSMVSAGCVISGALVEGSVIFNNCHIHSHSLVKSSVVLPEVRIGEHCQIHRAIIDRGTIIPDHFQVGVNTEEDEARGFRVTENNITLVTPDMLGQHLHMTR